MSDLLTREQILEAEDLLYEEVEVPEWGGSVRVKGLTGTERDSFERTIITNIDGRGPARTNLQNFRAKLVAWSVVDEEDKILFTQADVQALGQKSAQALQRVFDVAQRLSGLSPEDVEEMTKNSDNGQSEDIGSA